MIYLSTGPTPVPVSEAFAPNPMLMSVQQQQQQISKETRSSDPEEDNKRTEALLEDIRKINTLSEAERATLYTLMNHLKKVAIHSDQNKMTCQNLAVCFGPVLLGPVSTGATKG